MAGARGEVVAWGLRPLRGPEPQRGGARRVVVHVEVHVASYAGLDLPATLAAFGDACEARLARTGVAFERG
jgi:hypothetical protein